MASPVIFTVVDSPASQEAAADSDDEFYTELGAIMPNARQLMMTLPNVPTSGSELVLALDPADFSGMVWNAAEFLLLMFAGAVDCGDVDVSLVGTCVVEVGAGTGALSIGVAALGARRVVATDQEEALALLGTNIERNSFSNAVSAMKLEWGEAKTLAALIVDEQFDLVLSTDCIYNQFSHASLRRTLHALAVRPSARILIAWGDRDSPQDAFFAHDEFARLFEVRASLDVTHRGQCIHVRELRNR